MLGLQFKSAGASWAACLEHLEAHSHQGQTCPYNGTDTIYALSLFLFAEAAAARVILEIGIGPESVSGTAFLYSLARRGGHLISIDIEPSLPQPIYRQLAEELGVAWTICHGDSLELEPPLPAASVDLLYIDGNHDAAHAEGDLKKYLPSLRPGGYLLIDDFPPQAGVGEGREGLEAQVPWFLHLAHDAPAGNGRLIWQRPLR